ncbi:ATP-binding cassette-type vacuolar membrane transporter-like protein Hmt1 [Delitschia confertaspora ATCC 74209]|uniref:ATP-binding cassette-type vacuolar membrane transporter-like protein Hmt1 n=1 Tax=Delitschia confertaspora ATCC 74209 TaxID=1513339 RepID=A0A9P4JPC0_9PLEO|nr:ATP-binding cassette-type vacuolar membrane transporter-like protein Hmt1 [Delitschia confertaspora ATCC 74209]
MAFIMDSQLGALRSEAATLAAISILNYMHAPAMGFSYIAALTFAFCTLQKSKPLDSKRKRVTVSLLSVLVLSYVAQALYYLVRVFADDSWTAPQHTVIHVLSSILVLGFIDISLYKADSLVWHPYFGTFLFNFFFETTLCALNAVSHSSHDRLNGVPFILNAIRLAVTLGLVVDGFLILIQTRGEKGTDEEGQSLLGKPVNGTATAPTANGGDGYGTIAQDPASDEEEEPEDRDKEIKEQQRKRLEEQGGWFGYIKGFAIFLPYLWPKDDWRIMACLAIRCLDVVQGRILNLLTPRQVGIITDHLTNGSHTMPWKDIGLWTLYSWLGSFAGFGIINSLASTFVQNYSYKRICDLAFNHVMNLSMDFHSNKDSGEVLKSVDQAESLNSLIELVLFDVCPVLLDLVVAMWYVTHLFDMYMAFIVLSMGLAYVWLGISFTSWTQPKRRSYVEKSRTENKTVYESISNWQTVAYFNRGPFERDRYKSAVQNTITAQYAYMFRSYGGHAVQDVLMTFGFAGCCVLAISQIVSGHKPIGNLITLIMYWDTMMSPLWTMAYSYRHIASTLIDAERLLQLLNTKPSVADTEKPKDLIIKDCKVEYNHVGFAYDERKPVLKDVSFVAEPGQTIAFVGETGGGKSTMLKLLFRFYDVTSGSIMIDGQDLRSVTQSSLRDALGVVPQDPALFNQTIRENVRYARLDATDAEIEEACKAAAVHDKIMTFPDGYKSKVGERGVKLSGGELQRVAIARVLLKNPKIVMLDEATSAVDSSTEAQIQEAFKRLSSGRTTFVVAHRLSTIVEADLILVVDHGEIIERGSHNELLSLGGKYTELWTKQTAGVQSKANSTDDHDKDATMATELLIDITPEEEEEEEVDVLGKSTGRGDGSDRDESSVVQRKPLG